MADEFYKKIRERDYEGALYERGYARSPAPPVFAEPEPTTPTTPHSKALLQRHRVCLLIERGLSNFPDRLHGGDWRQIQAELQTFDPTLRGLRVHINQLIATTRRVALENGGSYGVWNLMEAASFQTWANDVVEALEQYRRDCEALHRG
jgi:hypothetical protein